MTDILTSPFRRLIVDMRLGVEDEEGEEWKDRGGKKRSSVLTQASSSESRNPYAEALTRNRSPEAEWMAVQRALSEYDEVNKMAEYNIDPSIWERLNKARLKKVAKEMDLKNATYRLNSTTAFLQVSPGVASVRRKLAITVQFEYI